MELPLRLNWSGRSVLTNGKHPKTNNLNILALGTAPSACFLERGSSLLIGSLRNNDGDGYENVTWKVNSGCFKLNNAYSVSFNSSNVGSFFWSWIFIEGQEKKKKVFVWCSLSPQNVQWRQRNVQKSVIHVQSCCFADLNLLLFCRSRWRRRLRCLSSGSL